MIFMLVELRANTNLKRIWKDFIGSCPRPSNLNNRANCVWDFAYKFLWLS